MLAAAERLGEPTLPELRREFPHLTASTLARSLSALEDRGLLEISGDPHWLYVGDPRGIDGAPQIPDTEIVRFRRSGER